LHTKISPDTPNFIKNHLILPLIVLAMTMLCLEFTDLDIWLASHFYDAKHHRWPYRDGWLTQTVLHKGGRYLVYALGVGLLLFWIESCRAKSNFRHLSKHLGYLLLASLSGPLIITYLKSHTHIYCPWDVSLFGSSKPHVRLFDSISDNMTVGHCFPSGHSGLGFAFVSVYYFFLIVKPDYKYYGLWAGLIAGFVFGITQEIRGAHFFSHDVVSLAICWFSSLLLFLAFYRKKLT
jgi:membrane-associated PAP2 superfamily phosphatase